MHYRNKRHFLHKLYYEVVASKYRKKEIFRPPDRNNIKASTSLQIVLSFSLSRVNIHFLLLHHKIQRAGHRKMTCVIPEK
jgi:hypothetical protein